MKLLFILLSALSSHASVRVIDADQIRSSDRASTWKFPFSSQDVLGRTAAQTMTNKTIAAGSNTITGLTDTNLSGAAGINNVNLSLMNSSTVKANISASAGTPTDITAGQLTAMITTFTGDTGTGAGQRGLVPAPSAGDTGLGKFLMSNGGYSVPPIPITPSATYGATIYSTGTAWAASVVAIPGCVTVSASDIDWSQGNCFLKTLSANTAFTFSKRVAGQTIIVRIKNPSTFTYTFPNTNTQGNSVLWANSTIPTASTAGKKDIVTVFYDGTEMFGAFNQAFGGF